MPTSASGTKTTPSRSARSTSGIGRRRQDSRDSLSSLSLSNMRVMSHQNTYPSCVPLHYILPSYAHQDSRTCPPLLSFFCAIVLLTSVRIRFHRQKHAKKPRFLHKFCKYSCFIRNFRQICGEVSNAGHIRSLEIFIFPR